MTVTDLHRDLADLIAEASDGLLGLTSLGYVRLIQAVERRYGVAVEPDDDLAALDTVEALVEYLRERGIE